MHRKIVPILLVLLIQSSWIFAQDIVTTISPLQAVVESLTKNSEIKSQLLLNKKESVHAFRLKPSNVLQIKKAKLLVAVSPLLEIPLQKAFKDPEISKKTLFLENLSVVKLPIRNNETFYHNDEHHDEHKGEHHDEHEGEHHDEHAGHDSEDHHDELDLHYWMHPENMKELAKEVTTKLNEISPQQKQIFEKNLKTFLEGVDQTVSKIKRGFETKKVAPFLVYHDAYQYFESYFGVQAMGSVYSNPLISLGGKGYLTIEQKIKELEIKCLFFEPQFNDPAVRNIGNKFSLKMLVVDPLQVTPNEQGTRNYSEFLTSMANSFHACS